ncbi:MAG: DNA recombination protein RmuC [Elusimicrobiota bacterium]|jgi:DNA recombination protein RmuC|nr:DNA recombination protein RmuC [Elusimicrobiota bacterium]
MFLSAIIAFIIGAAAGALSIWGRMKIYKDLYEKSLNENNFLRKQIDEKVLLIKNLEIEKAAVMSEKKSLEEIKKHQEETFKTISEESKNSFKILAATALKEERGNLDLRSREILDPLKNDIKNFTQQIENLKSEQMQRHIKLETVIEQTKEMNRNLAKEASDLSTALKNKKVQGNWGEMILENILQASGLKEGREYIKQPFFRSENNEKQYPDFIIMLPQGRKIIIDSKMSIENYKNWAVETDAEEKESFLLQHIQNIRKHIDELSDKQYQKLLKEKGLEFVIMFIPIEYAYFIALEKDNSLNEYANKNKVAIATASSIFPVLGLIENLWRMEKANKNNLEIIKVGEDMHKRVSAFIKNMEDLGNALSSVQKKYDEAVNRLYKGRDSIVKSVSKLEELGIKHQKSVKENLEISEHEISENKEIESPSHPDLAPTLKL